MKTWITVCLIGLLILFAVGCEVEPVVPPEPSPFTHSSVTVVSGRYSIQPVSYMGYINEFDRDGAVVFADGAGYRAMKPEDVEHPAFPTLVLHKSVRAQVTEAGSEIEDSVWVLTMERERLEGVFTFAQLSELEAGEYLIVFGEKTDTRRGDESIQSYTIRGQDCVFKLIVD